MIEIEGPLKFEQKEANETIQKIGEIVNGAIHALREVAPNGLHMQKLENSLVAHAALLSYDVIEESLDADIPRRLEQGLLFHGKKTLVEMNSEDQEADIHLFKPEEFMFSGKDQVVMQCLDAKEKTNKENFPVLSQMHYHLQSVLDGFIIEFPEHAAVDNPMERLVQAVWLEIIDMASTRNLGEYWNKNIGCPEIDCDLLSDALGSMGVDNKLYDD